MLPSWVDIPPIRIPLHRPTSHDHDSMRERGLAALCLLVTLAACSTPAAPAELFFTVSPTAAGAVVEMEVRGGPSDRVWVGFGVGPGVSTAFAERIGDVAAVASDGTPLEIQPYGEAGYAVRLQDDEPWRLRYQANLRPSAGESDFYRSSVRDEDYLVMVGSDLWARIYADPAPLSFRPDNRPPGRADAARITVDLERDSGWTVVGASAPATLHSFRFTEHPAATVLIAGRFDDPRGAPGLRMHAHPAWDGFGVDAGDMTTALITDLRQRLGTPDDRTAAVVMLPLPAALRPPRGLRTAGMVRDHTALLYGDLASGQRPSPDRIEAAMAVFIAHELFHLYVPSAIQVTRDLSWLSEGWAMHMGRLAAQGAGYVDPADARQQIERTYRRYLDMGGYRAGSLPRAAMGSESTRDLLYLRGELVFRLLQKDWQAGGSAGTFEEQLWRRLQDAYRGDALDSDSVHAVLSSMFDARTVQRYVVGTAPLTRGILGLDD